MGVISNLTKPKGFIMKIPISNHELYSSFYFTDNSFVLVAVATKARLLWKCNLQNTPQTTRRAEGGLISGGIPLPSCGFLHHRAGYLRGRWNDCEWFQSQHLKEEVSQLPGVINSFSLNCYNFLDEFLKFIVSIFLVAFNSKNTSIL